MALHHVGRPTKEYRTMATTVLERGNLGALTERDAESIRRLERYVGELQFARALASS